MLVLIILLFFSVALNIALIFCSVMRRADEDMHVIRLREGLRVE
jgi:hypothetical protein